MKKSLPLIILALFGDFVTRWMCFSLAHSGYAPYLTRIISKS